jgi:Protein of unknown function (DUF3047)
MAAKLAIKPVFHLAIGLASMGFTSAAFAAEPSAFSGAAGNQLPAGWRIVGLPERYAKPLTAIDITSLDGAKVLRLKADNSYGNAVYATSSSPASISFKWRLDKPLLKANLREKATEDIALKVCLSFDMPVGNIPGAERNIFRIAQFTSPEKLPTATLCYIWDHALPVGTELASPYTQRLHYIVLNSGEAQLGTWQAHKRSIAADFKRAFGAESEATPALSALLVGADADNTHDASLGYVGDIMLAP